MPGPCAGPDEAAPKASDWEGFGHVGHGGARGGSWGKHVHTEAGDKTGHRGSDVGEPKAGTGQGAALDSAPRVDRRPPFRKKEGAEAGSLAGRGVGLVQADGGQSPLRRVESWEDARRALTEQGKELGVRQP